MANDQSPPPFLPTHIFESELSTSIAERSTFGLMSRMSLVLLTTIRDGTGSVHPEMRNSSHQNLCTQITRFRPWRDRCDLPPWVVYQSVCIAELSVPKISMACESTTPSASGVCSVCGVPTSTILLALRSMNAHSVECSDATP